MPKVIAFYQAYLHRPPEEWQYMPMMTEAAPEFAKRFPEAARSSTTSTCCTTTSTTSSRGPTLSDTPGQAAAILKILPIYLNLSHAVNDRYPDFHEKTGTHAGGHARMSMTDMGPRPRRSNDVAHRSVPAGDSRSQLDNRHPSLATTLRGQL